MTNGNLNGNFCGNYTGILCWTRIDRLSAAGCSDDESHRQRSLDKATEPEASLREASRFSVALSERPVSVRLRSSWGPSAPTSILVAQPPSALPNRHSRTGHWSHPTSIWAKPKARYGQTKGRSCNMWRCIPYRFRVPLSIPHSITDPPKIRVGAESCVTPPPPRGKPRTESGQQANQRGETNENSGENKCETRLQIPLKPR